MKCRLEFDDRNAPYLRSHSSTRLRTEDASAHVNWARHSADTASIDLNSRPRIRAHPTGFIPISVVVSLAILIAPLMISGCGGGGDSSPINSSDGGTLGGGVGNGSPTTAGAPTITSIAPSVASAGDLVVIQGQNLATAVPPVSPQERTINTATTAPVQVVFGLEPATILSSTATSIVVTVPDGLTTGNVVAAIGSKRSNSISFINAAPEVTSLPLMKATVGQTYNYQAQCRDAFDRPRYICRQNNIPRSVLHAPFQWIERCGTVLGEVLPQLSNNSINDSRSLPLMAKNERSEL